MLGAVTSRRLLWLVMPVGVQAKVVKTLGKRCLHTSSLHTATGWVTKGVLKKRISNETFRTVGINAMRLSQRPLSTSDNTQSFSAPVLGTSINIDQDFLSHVMLPDFDAVLPEVRVTDLFSRLV